MSGSFPRFETAEKILKNGKVLKSEAASYGHAAKVLDIAIKVYVYYCAQPNAEVAERLVPFLHGAVDTALMKHLNYPRTAIKDINEKAYAGTSSRLCARESERCKASAPCNTTTSCGGSLTRRQSRAIRRHHVAVA